MRRSVRLSGIALAVVAVSAWAVAAAEGTASSVPVHVKPRKGGPGTRFLVAFRAPLAAGRFGTLNRYYIVAVNGHPRGGCVSSASATVPTAAAHARVRVKLDPRHYGGRWCKGMFHGQVEEVQGPQCVKGQLCPAFVSMLGTVGKFSFRVKRAAPKHSGGDTKPPKFAGLKSAFACTPGPQRPGQTTRYTLSWDAATDDKTPSSKIVYDIFKSNTSGGENFSKPSWTTKPGVTTFKTPGLSSHMTVYFVARARDAAGNEDHNRVERSGIDPCV